MNITTIIAVIDAVPAWAVGIGFVMLMASVAVTLPFAMTKASLPDFVGRMIQKK